MLSSLGSVTIGSLYDGASRPLAMRTTLSQASDTNVTSRRENKKEWPAHSMTAAYRSSQRKDGSFKRREGN